MALAICERITRLLQLRHNEAYYKYLCHIQYCDLKPFYDKFCNDFKYIKIKRMKGQSRYKNSIQFGNCPNRLQTVDEDEYMEVLNKARAYFDDYFNIKVNYDTYGKELEF